MTYATTYDLNDFSNSNLNRPTFSSLSNPRYSFLIRNQIPRQPSPRLTLDSHKIRQFAKIFLFASLFFDVSADGTIKIAPRLLSVQPVGRIGLGFLSFRQHGRDDVLFVDSEEKKEIWRPSRFFSR